jgi:protein-S-isoprenylcysteine O-methyltransferase Ste14
MTSPATPPDHSGVVFPPPFVYAGLFLAGYLVHRLVPVALVPGAGWLQWPGWLLVVVGVGFAVTAASTFRRAGTHVNPRKPATMVVTHGPFRLTRNPMYVSLATVYLGATALVNSLWPLLFFPPAVWVISRYVIAREEAYLERKFGHAYLDYKAKVRRWL